MVRSLEELQIMLFEQGRWTIVSAAEIRAEISEAHRLCYEAGDKTAPRRLLAIHRDFAREPWVQNWLADRAAIKASQRRGPGRGRAKSADLREILLVAHVDATRARTGLSPNATFKKLGSDGSVGLSPSRIRDLYYETRDRSWAFLIE